ncbi:acetate--CoA ligase [Nodularia spumigena]|uniref:acetate--CoA ligase n=1 Tax=Nodularia spumigena TaxID=70799 RepID=UPI002B1ECB20|nr:acetate--CoA ligase [Nodularia spumigena]MEA5557676.1 acetate--CoA ligase [Nodularia spumigena CH309]
MSQSIESSLHENRTFPPVSPLTLGVPRWLVDSRLTYDAMHRRSLEDPEGFWGDIAQELHWFKPWSKVLEWNVPDAQWFVGATTNLCYNCVDRQVDQGHGDELAILWEGEPVSGKHGQGPEVRRLTYSDLKRDVSKFANAMKSLGVKKGDVVTIYMGMVPEVAIAMLACARIGAVHSVIFGGFSSQAIVDRMLDANSRVIITCDGAYRRGSIVPLKESVDAACFQLAESGHEVQSVIVYSRIGNQIAWHSGRDHSFKDLVLAASPDCPCEPMDAEDMLFLLYTSGSTGKPKGIVHTTGGYMVYTYLTSKLTFNLIPGHNQLYWCTADVGWVTGHSYILYGILPNRVPTLMFEGAPNFPKEDRFWEIIERHKVTHFYTAPTAIRAFMKWGDEHPMAHDLSSLQVLGTVGEPINPEAWMWYHETIGAQERPIVDTWWQTETGGHMITPLPGVTTTKPGSCTLPFFGVDAAIVDEEGNEVPHNSGGLLVIRKPWPSMLRGIHGDRQRFVDTYFSRIPGMYFTGDGARRDTDGYFWVMGRVDDVINVSGHRLGTMEVESALVSHEAIVEAAVVGMPHEIKGTGIAAFVTLANGFDPADAPAAERLKAAIREHVAKEIGAIAKPDQIRFTPSLPKTRSGKIMRRLLRSIAAGETRITQDTTTLEDYTILAKLSETSEG